MIRETSAVTARQSLGDLLNQVQYRNDSVLITKDGKPVAALIDVALFERIRRLRDEFTRLTDALNGTYAGVDPTIARSEIGEAVRTARKARARREQTRKKKPKSNDACRPRYERVRIEADATGGHPGTDSRGWTGRRIRDRALRNHIGGNWRSSALPEGAKAHRSSDEELDRYVQALRYMADVTDPAGMVVDVPGDKDDEVILATLVVAKADWLVTGDAALLALAHRYPIIRPAALVARYLS